MNSWSHRAFLRGVGMNFFCPPDDEKGHRHWHMVDGHLGLMRVQWRPGIDVWRGAEGERWTAEFAFANHWKYIGLAEDQSGGVP
jgi:hypothetical protein